MGPSLPRQERCFDSLWKLGVTDLSCLSDLANRLMLRVGEEEQGLELVTVGQEDLT